MTDTLPSRVLMLLPDEDAKTASPHAALSLAASYYLFRDTGLEVVLATRLGGFTSISAEMRRLTEEPVVSRMLADAFARDELSETVPIDKVFVDDFSALVLFVATAETARPEIAGVIDAFAAAGKPAVPFEIASLPGHDGWAREVIRRAEGKG